MAETVASLKATLGLDDSQFQKKTKSIGKLVAGAAFTGAIVAGAGKAIAAFEEFEDKMTAVQTLLDGDAKAAVADFSAEILDMTKRVPQSATQLADAMFDVVSAGVPAGEAIQFLEQSSKLAVAGVTDAKTAVNGMTSAFNAFSKDGLTAANISDQFFTAQKLGKTTIAELSNTIGRVAPTAAAMNISLSETLGTVSSLTTKGIATSEAVTGMKAALTGIIKPSSEAKEKLGKLGVEFSESALKQKGFVGVLKDAKKRLDESGGSFSDLFGSVEALNVVLALSDDNFEGVSGAIDKVGNSSGITEKKFKEQAATLKNLRKIVGNYITAWTNQFLGKLVPALIKTGSLYKDYILKPLKVVFDFVTDSFGGAEAIIENFKFFTIRVFLDLKQRVEYILAVLTNIIRAPFSWDTYKEIFLTFTTRIIDTFTNIGKAIKAGLTFNFNSMKDLAKKTLDVITKETGKNKIDLVNLQKKHNKEIENLSTKHNKTLKDILDKRLKDSKNAMQETSDESKDMMNDISDSIESSSENVSDGLESQVDSTKDFIQQSTDAVNRFLSNSVNGMMAALTLSEENLSNSIEYAINTVLDAAEKEKEINENLAKTIEQIKEDSNKRIEDAKKSSIERQEDLDRNYARRREDLEREKQRDLSDISNLSAEERKIREKEINEKYNRDIEDLEIDKSRDTEDLKRESSDKIAEITQDSLDREVEANEKANEEREALQKDFIKVAVNAIIDQLSSQLIAWAAAETAKLIMAAPATFGGSLLGIPIVAGQLGLGLAGLNALRLKNGGQFVVDQPTMVGPNVMAGESGPERVTVEPLSRIANNQGMGSKNVSIQNMNITLPNVTNAQQFANELKSITDDDFFASSLGKFQTV